MRSFHLERVQSNTRVFLAAMSLLNSFQVTRDYHFGNWPVCPDMDFQSYVTFLSFVNKCQLSLLVFHSFGLCYLLQVTT